MCSSLIISHNLGDMQQCTPPHISSQLPMSWLGERGADEIAKYKHTVIQLLRKDFSGTDIKKC